MKKRIVASCLPAAFLVSWLATHGVAHAQATAATAGSGAAPKPVSAAAAYGIDRREIRAQLMPRRFTTIAAEIGAKIEQLPLREGGSFRAGQLLVRFDCSLQQAQWARAKADLEGAQTTVQANERLAQLNTIGQLELDLSRTAVSKANADLRVQQAVLSKCDIKAPYAGRVAEQKAREQQYVQPGQPLLEIIEDSVLELEFLVPSHWLAWLKPGGRFQVTIDETGKTYPARFVRIGARVDPVSQSIKVAAAIEGQNPELIAGMGGKVLITPPDATTATSQR